MRAFAGLFLAALTACDSGTEQRKEVAGTRAVMRPQELPPPGAVPRGADATAAALRPPGPRVSPTLLARGRERFAIFCTPCHGAAGAGDGPVVGRGFPAPPSYHEERLRAVQPEHIVAVISNGVGRMPSYADRVPPADRWAIAHYIKALQEKRAVESLP